MNASEAIEHRIEHPAHPLYAVNRAYRAYQQAVLQALVLFGYDGPAQERIAFYQEPLECYNAEVRKALRAGLRFSFVKVPPPRFGYLALDR